MSFSNQKGMLACRRFEIPYRTFGNGKDIICVNGRQQSMAMWLSFLDYFRDKYRITLFDFPYQGKAKIVNGPAHVSLSEEVEILRAVIETLGIQHPTLCSASWGGVITLSFAVKYPACAARLITASVGLRPNGLMREVIRKGAGMNREDRYQMAHVIINNFGKNLPQDVKNQIIKQFHVMTEDQIQAFSEHGMAVILAESLDKVVPLSEVTTPTTILYGEYDMIIDIKDVNAMAALIPNCDLQIIPGTGHFMHLENNKVFEIYEKILEAEPQRPLLVK